MFAINFFTLDVHGDDPSKCYPDQVPDQELQQRNALKNI